MPRRHDRVFATDHLQEDLRGRSVRGGAVVLVAHAAKFVLSLGSTAILARLLTPEDFGLVAMVTAVTGFVALFQDMGLSAATIQRQDITHEQVSALFWFNLGASALLAIVVAATGPLLARLYSEPRLVVVTLFIAATFIAGGLTAQHYALIERQMRFVSASLVHLASLVIGIGVAVWMAAAGAGYWALVGQLLATSFGVAVLSWVLSGWWPGLPRRGAGVRSMLALGANLTGSNTLTYVTRNADNVLIGSAIGAAPLGLYSKAYNLLMLPIRQLNSPLNGVALPTLSRLQSDPARFRRYYLRAIGLLAFVGMPIVVFAFVDADRLVLTVLGPQWTQAGAIFRFLAPAALVGTFSVAPAWVLVPFGRADRLFKWSLIAAPVTVGGFAVGLLWGVDGVAASFSATSVALVAPMMAYSLRGSPVSFGEFAIVVGRPFAASAVAGGLVYAAAAAAALALPTPVELLVDLVIYGGLYLLVWMVLPGGVRALAEHSEVARSFMPFDRVIGRLRRA